MSESMNLDYDAVFTKKSFENIDNSKMMTILVDKLEFMTTLCFRMHEKIEVMEFRTKEIEAKLGNDTNNRLRKESQVKKDFGNVKMACIEKRIGAHKVVIINHIPHNLCSIYNIIP